MFSADDYDKLEFGTAELVVLISGPVVFVSLIFMIGFFAYYQYQHRRPRGYMAPEISGGEVVPFVQPGSESLREMMFDYSGSGSGMFDMLGSYGNCFRNGSAETFYFETYKCIKN